jgi:hypothetical protein
LLLPSFQADFDTALSEFIEAMKVDRGFNDECSRKACIAIFRYLGEESDITKSTVGRLDPCCIRKTGRSIPIPIPTPISCGQLFDG